MRHAYLIKSLYVFLLNVTHIKKPHPSCCVKFAQLFKICLSLTDIIFMNQQLKKCREHAAYKYMLKLRVNLPDFNAVLSPVVTPAHFTIFLSDAPKKPFSRNSHFAALCIRSNVVGLISSMFSISYITGDCEIPCAYIYIYTFHNYNTKTA